MDSTIKVSIGMPVYNGEAFIHQAIASLLAQDEKCFELIISDNASTDKTSIICSDYANKDNRIRYIQNKVNIGAEKNFYKVLTEARGEFFMWAAHDDIWEPSFISSTLQLFKKNPDAAIAFSLFNNVDIYDNEIKKYQIGELTSKDLFERLLCFMSMAENKGKANIIYGLLKRKNVLAISGFHTGKKPLWGADMLTVFKLLIPGYLVLDDRLLFHKRIPAEDETSRIKYRNIADKLQHKINEHIAYLKDNHNYFWEYFKIIKTVEKLSLLQKAQFSFLLLKREIHAAFHK